jgi:ubiquinone/menaquinone biosynthesis C-methylase UbiE
MLEKRTMNPLNMRGEWNGWTAILYDAVIARGMRPIYDELMSQILARFPLDAATRILDVGCGSGHATATLARRLPQASVVGVDLTERAIALAKATYGSLPNLRFRTADAMDLPFESGAFDLVISTGSIKHWPSAERGLAETLRVLDPEGWIVILESDPRCTPAQATRFVRYWHYVPAPFGIFAASYFRRYVAGQSPTADRIAHWLEALDASVVCAESVSKFPLSLVVARKPPARIALTT